MNVNLNDDFFKKSKYYQDFIKKYKKSHQSIEDIDMELRWVFHKLFDKKVEDIYRFYDSSGLSIGSICQGKGSKKKKK